MSGWGAPPPYAGYPPPVYGAPPPYAAPPPYGHAPPVQYDSTGEEIRTIFITGFPDDVKDRELNNLMRFVPGYVASQMNWKNGQAQGFALFDTGAAALAACNQVAHIQFDEASVLRAEMARKNMYVKDDPAAKRSRYGPGGFTGASSSSTYIAPADPAAAPIVPVQPQGFAPVTNVGDNPPCNTLFVGNLGDGVSEQELRGLFGAQAGFRQLKVNRGAKSVTCFIEFADLSTAMVVHQSLQGAVLASSDRGGIRIQYSKNPFGKRKDAPA